MSIALPERGPLVLARPDRLGDVIIATACLEPLRARFPEREIYFIAAEIWRPLLAGHPLLAGFIPLDNQLSAKLRALQPAAIVHLHPHRACAQAAAAVEIPVRIGYREKTTQELLTHAITDRRAEGTRHEGAYQFDLLRELDVREPSRLQTAVAWPAADLQTLRAKLPWPLEAKRFAVIHAGANSPKKCWPRARFLTLAQHLRRTGLSIVWTGTEPRRRHLARLDLNGRTNVGELAWLLKHAEILITNDSGPAHLAAAADCPTVVLFGRTEPEYGPVRWRPLADRAVIVAATAGRRWWEGSRAFWRRAFRTISVAQVLAATRSLSATPEPLRLLSIIIPARNEAANLPTTIRHLRQELETQQIPHEIIPIDDHSTDATWAILEKMAGDEASVRPVQNLGPGGFGRAIRCGFNHARGDAVVIMMADESDAPADVTRYWRELQGGADCVFGSRFIPGGGVTDYPPLKLILNRLANTFLRALFRLPLNDTTNAFKAYRTTVIAACQPLRSTQFELTVELPLLAITHGFSCKIIPIRWRNRRQGVSKLKIPEMGSRYLATSLAIWWNMNSTRLLR